jgi:hypothetical protein
MENKKVGKILNYSRDLGRAAWPIIKEAGIVIFEAVGEAVIAYLVESLRNSKKK